MSSDAVAAVRANAEVQADRKKRDGRLNLYLGQAYHARNNGDARVVEEAFRKLVNADKTFRTEAEKRLASLTKAIRDRDHISRVHHDILTKVLND